MDLTSLLFPLLILVLFSTIFLSGRKQRRQVQEMQALQAALEPGDVVMTTSGLRGTVVDASYEETVDLEIADGVVTTWVRAAVKNKVDPAPAAPADAEPADVAPAHPDHAESAHSESALSLEKLQKDDSANGTPRTT
jgi:preprotein translocase subunit YajC